MKHDEESKTLGLLPKVSVNLIVLLAASLPPSEVFEGSFSKGILHQNEIHSLKLTASLPLKIPMVGSDEFPFSGFGLSLGDMLVSGRVNEIGSDSTGFFALMTDGAQRIPMAHVIAGWSRTYQHPLKYGINHTYQTWWRITAMNTSTPYTIFVTMYTAH